MSIKAQNIMIQITILCFSHWMSNNVVLNPKIKFPFGKSSEMLNIKHMCTCLFSAAFSQPRGWNHNLGYFLPAGEWINKYSPSTFWDVILPQEGLMHWHRLQCGWALKPRCPVRDARNKRPHGALFPLYEMSRISKSRETESRSVGVRGWEGGWLLKGHGVPCWGMGVLGAR